MAQRALVVKLSGFLCGLSGWVAVGTPIQAAENYAAWSYSTDITLDTSPAGADVAGGVTEFPVLIRLASGNFPFAQARGKGQDIRFAKADGTHLAYQIDRWDSAGSVAAIWVKTDVAGNKAGQILRCYWGKSDAADSSSGNAVFSQGFTQVWHLGEAGTVVRANAVATGNVAAPVNYEGDESTLGIIGLADNFDGVSPDDYLDVGDGYSEYAAGFTYSVWVYPTATNKWIHILDLGNGQLKDNILINRSGTSNDLEFSNCVGAVPASLQVPGAWINDQWQLLTVTVAGSDARIYRNGALLGSATLSNTVSGVTRTENFIGRSNWSVDEYYRGMVDEPELAKVARSAEWIRLCFQNQKANQTLVSLKPLNGCQARMNPPKDTSAQEGSIVNLKGSADCASGLSWSVVSGPAPRILDPEAGTLVVTLPRVTGDTAIVYRLTAMFSDSSAYRDVRVKVLEAIPSPEFTLTAPASWNGKDTLAIRPTITNLTAVRASRDSVINWRWTYTGPEADTTWLKDGLRLNNSHDGNLEIRLCLDNGGAALCKNAAIIVSGSSSVAPAKKARYRAWRKPHWDAKGRRL